MKMKKFLKIITLAISFLTAGFSFGLTGDIYEIFPCDQDGNYKDYGASVENPIRQRGIDNPLYFCVRLISRTSEPEDSAWQMEHRDSVVERPWQLGIFVSGEEKRATLEQCKRNANNGAFTDLIFSYQPKAGDVALPIVFATKNGPAFNNVTGESEDERISLYKSGKNVIFNKRGDELRFWLWNSNPDNPIDPGTPNPSGERSKDYTLLNCGFYVKTLEFVKEADPITIKRGEERQLAIKVANGTGDPLGSENPVKLYVWTTNDNVEASRNTLDVEIKLDDKGNKWSTKVGVVEFEVGQSQSYFYIKGIKENPETDPDKTIDLFLSPYPNFNYFSAGDRILDYETMKVKCSGVSEPEVIIEVPSEVTANGDYTNSVAAVKVRLNQPLVSGTELKLRINPTYADGGTADGIYDYIRFSTKPAFQGQPNDGAMELTFSGTEIEKIFYLYCYDAPNSIILTPEAIGTTDYKLTPITFNILAGKPKILEPQADLEKAYITGSVNEDIPLRIKISDVRAHEKDDGKKYRYKIWYMRPNDLEYQEMDGVYYCATGGYLLKLKYDEKTDSYTQTTEQPAIQFLGSGENLNCSIYVALDDTLAETSDVRSFTANIKPPRTITLTPNYSTFDEGEHVTFDIKLSEALEGGMPIYGYLKASITDDSVQEKFESDEPNSYDVILGINGTKKNEKGETVTNEVNGVQFFGTEASCSFLLKDGYAGTGLKVSFEVILSYDAAWDGSSAHRKVTGYILTKRPTITVNNVEPKVMDIKRIIKKTEGDDEILYQDFAPIPVRSVCEFKAIHDDLHEDVLNETITNRWKFIFNDRTYQTLEIDASEEASFTPMKVGRWTIRVEAKDKDMKNYSSTYREFSLDVIEKPYVYVEADGEYTETNKYQQIKVGVNYFDPLDTPLKVKITVVPPSAPDGGDVGKLELLCEGGVEKDPTDSNGYLIDIDDEEPRTIYIDKVDGTEVSEELGFKIKAEVVSKDVLPSSKQPADTYYAKYEADKKDDVIKLINNEPVFGRNMQFQEATNAWDVTSGAATLYPINIDIAGDAYYDLNTEWMDEYYDNTVGYDLDGKIVLFEDGKDKKVKGLKVEISGVNILNPTNFYISKAWSKKFIPIFSDDPVGLRTVKVIVTDKDGLYNVREYRYNVKPSKYLVTSAHGPNGGEGSSALSRKYTYEKGAKLIGKGHTFVEEDAKISLLEAKDWRIRWTCGTASYAYIWAFGYKVEDTKGDDGSLDDGRDVAINEKGELYNKNDKTQEVYKYPEAGYSYFDKKDSFSYAWILHKQGDGSQIQSEILGGVFNIETTSKKAKASKVILPAEQTQDGHFVETEVEAIFSKEYYPEDNLGDINGDEIPDVFAHKDWKGGNMIALQYGDILNNDLLSLTDFNKDEDYLPAICENTQNLARNFYNHAPKKENADNEGSATFAPLGPAFTAKMEIRGYHPGLNAVDEAESDPVFVEYDKNGDPILEKVPGHFSYTNELQAWRIFKHKKGDLLEENWDTAFPTKDDLVEWSPEPRGIRGDNIEDTPISRMDPTVEDTDGDGYPDGWEYYFWYIAKITVPVYQWEKEGNPLGHANLRFRRFDFENVSKGTEIPPEEVEAAFNPCIPRTASLRDFDEDGLSDKEELALGTNPCNWDTDGDGMCDAWEAMWGLDPLNPKDWMGNPDGDFMAYWELPGGICYIQENESIIFYYDIDQQVFLTGIDIDPNTKTLIANKPKLREIKIKPMLDNDGAAIEYGIVQGYETEGADGKIEFDIWGRPMANVESVKLVSLKAGDGVFSIDPLPSYIFIHDQVRKIWGFDPRTAWNFVNGYVSNRDILDTAKLAINTMPYTSYDEYLLIQYRRDFGISYISEASPEEDTVNAWIKVLGTNPNILKDDAGEITQHGADTDGDGVPDGWEVYTYRCPNSAPKKDENGIGTSIKFDFDDDKLDYMLEFAGTDSCNAYSGCKSIYDNHPGNTKGWFNKFYPTNPGFDIDSSFGDNHEDGADTDRDGITDAQEGDVFKCKFYNGGEKNDNCVLGFIYGSPFDDNSKCIRGGGMNPCSIDTDLDGIPDGWEMQHAGIPVDATTGSTVDPLNGGNAGGVKISDGTLVADGVYNRIANSAAGSETSTNGVASVSNVVDSVSQVVYLAGGMDATWADSGSDSRASELGTSFDPLLGLARDVDYDHDGLQNYQEYYIQAMRHLRYDDISTPLMGRLLTENPGNGHTQVFKDYVKFEPSDAGTFVDYAKAAWGDADSAINERVSYVKDLALSSALQPWTPEGWRSLGYFAPPIFGWDPAFLEGVGSYMWPLGGEVAPDPIFFGSIAEYYPRMIVPGPDASLASVAGYATTDPRIADTDGDGMDDFYEMFHGLNPILGTTAKSPEGTIWLVKETGSDIISAIYAEYSYEYYYVNPLDALTCFNAYLNEWTRPGYNFDGRRGGSPGVDAIATPMAYDPVMYPWIQGSAMVDSDGDGMRNDEERALANVADPMPRHTDPTPLWFTERTTPMSFVAQYYPTPSSIPGWGPSSKGPYELPSYSIMSSGSYMYSFEEGEGYDTDGDFKYDGDEVIATFDRTTDPQNFGDPARRQALYLDGVNSYALSRETQKRQNIPSDNSSDFLKQFTVECWVCPEKLDADQTVIDRSVAYVGSAISSDAAAIRSNFRIGITKDGKVYGMFDNSDAIESGDNVNKSCQYVYGPQLELNKWVHIALTYNGAELILYKDGETHVEWKAKTGLIPANGIIQIVQDPSITPVSCQPEPAALFIGARPKVAREVTGNPERALKAHDGGNESFNNVREFFKGFVDEVRIWDGARAESDIKADYRVRYDINKATKNRDAVLMSWMAGGTRNNNDGRPTLPPELLCHYNFVSLPGAVEKNYIAKTPLAFTDQVANAANGTYYTENQDANTAGLYPVTDKKVRGPSDIKIGWWNETKLRNTVYNDYRIIPWIQNTVMHLTPPDGSALDTYLYTPTFGAGYTLPEMLGYRSYVFNNSAQPYSSYNLRWDLFQKLFQAQRIVEQYGNSYAWLLAYRNFFVRNSFADTSDLVPLGGAFAKTAQNLWDGAPSDAWELTNSDKDADGLPCEWEEWCQNNYSNGTLHDKDITWDMLVTDGKGVTMKAGDAFKLDLILGWIPGHSYEPDYSAPVDTDSDNMPDWWEKMYGILDSTDVDDDDGDGLSNWAEYLLSQIFDLKDNNVPIKFSPINPMSVNKYNLDYFYKIGELYAGEIFTDHDFMEDVQEDAWGAKYTSRYAWDANNDNDGDGWSNFAEARYNALVKSIVAPSVSHVVGDSRIKDMPIPTLKLTLRYNGNRSLMSESGSGNGNNDDGGSISSGTHAPLVVQTYTDGDLIKPDATFNIQPGVSSANTVYVGTWEDKVVAGTLTPGHVSATSFKIELAQVARDDSYSFYVGDISAIDPITQLQFPVGYHSADYETYMKLFEKFGPEYIVLQSDEFRWSQFVDANVITVTEEGSICLLGERFGKVDLTSGDYSLNLGILQRIMAQGTNENAAVFNIQQSVLRFKYDSVVPELNPKKLDVYLGETPNGYVKEGLNTIMAFYDLNGDGKYTPGEPMGTATGVDVGWRQGKTEIELTDTTPMITRADLITGETDRKVLWGDEHGDVSSGSSTVPSTENNVRVRIFRCMVNGYYVSTASDRIDLETPVVEKYMNLKERSFIFEGDVLANGDLDLDWNGINEDAMPILGAYPETSNPTSVVYAVVFGGENEKTIDLKTSSTNLFATMITRSFDPVRAKPRLVQPGHNSIVQFNTHPTFKWYMEYGANTYTAFRIQILGDNQTPVWDSGIRRAPARDENGYYTFESDAYIGDCLENFKNYTWHVSMYNSKYRDDLWSEEKFGFRMNVPESGYDSVNVPVSVKYFGPSIVAGASSFVVEAFTTPDFTGIPAARVVVEDSATVTDKLTPHVGNVVLKGLSNANETYYIRAYADMNSYGTKRNRDSFESWGYACGQGKPGPRLFTPTAFEFNKNNPIEKPIDIYIEDVDTNGNSLPDAWEYQKYGRLHTDATDLNATLADMFIINDALAGKIETLVKGLNGRTATGYSNYITTSLTSPKMLALALGYNPESITVGQNGSIQVESKVESVEIKSVSFDAKGNVVVEIDGKLNTAEGNTNGLGFITLEGETKKTVICQVLWKSSLTDTEWTVKAEKKIQVGSGTKTITIRDVGSETSGFFKLVVTE